MTTMTETDLQAHAARLVDREVHLCVSTLIATVAAGYGEISARPNTNLKDLELLAEQAMELAAPIPDYEEAARDAGWVNIPAHAGFAGKKQPIDGGLWSKGGTTVYSAEQACLHDDIEPYDCEVYEHWAVSAWLAEKLEAKGEKIDQDFCGWNVWARTTTGQAISMDGVIRSIVAELHKSVEG